MPLIFTYSRAVNVWIPWMGEKNHKTDKEILMSMNKKHKNKKQQQKKHTNKTYIKPINSVIS